MDGSTDPLVSMHAVDITVAALLLLFAFRGYSRGLFHEVMTLLALLVSMTVAFRFTPDVAPQFAARIPGPSFVITGIAFLFLFGLVGMILRFGITMTERMWVSVGNAPSNRAAGAVFGVFKGAVLIGCAVLMLRTFVPVPVEPADTAGKIRGPLADLNTRVADSLFAARLADLTSGLFSTIVNAAELRLRMLATGHNEEP